MPQPRGAKFVPTGDRTLLIVGQDLDSLLHYRRDCNECPAPGGVTAYLGFYDLLSADSQFGGLGEAADGEPAADADWGAGRTSARRLADAFPNSTLALGVDISNSRRKGGLAEITRGLHDDKVVRLARFCRSLARPIYLRLGYEFDGAWNSGYEDPRTYIAAYRRIVDLMRAQGVENVDYVWQASASPIDDVLDGGRRENLRDWYPGADHVDWVALSWFLTPNEAPTVGRIKPPTQLQLAAEVLALARQEHKPVMIAEAAPQGYDIGHLTSSNRSPIWDGASGRGRVGKSADEIWREWYQPLFAYVAANSDTIRAVAYINALWDAQPMWAAPYAHGYWGDTRIQANDSIRQRWLAEIGRPVWLHGAAKLTTQLSRPAAHRQQREAPCTRATC